MSPIIGSLGAYPRHSQVACQSANYKQPSPSLGAPWLSVSASPPPPCGMQFPVGGAVVVVWRVVVGGGGGGGAACVVVVCTVGGGGGIAWVVAAWVVVVGVGVTLGAVGTAVACPFCGAGLAWWCRFLALCLGFGLAALVVVVAGVDWVVEVVLVAAALWLEVDDEAPQALTTNTSNAALRAVRRSLMAICKDATHLGLLPGSEQPMNAPQTASIRDRDTATIRRMEDHIRGSVLVVDDEPTITEVVARYLSRAGYATRVAANGREALEAAATQRPDLVVLDLMLPGIDGLEVMRRLRDQDRDRVAVILLTAKSEESERVIGLRLGADDYVVKPFSPAELVARVDAVLRRFDTSRTQEAPIELSDMTIDPTARQVFVRGEEVQLTHREFDVLLFLARHPGQAFSRNQLMDAVWQYSFYTDTSTVTVHVRRLRSKIEADPARPRHIQTVWGVGYRFQP
jgi:two-component system, OmpR family, response regulator ResD